VRLTPSLSTCRYNYHLLAGVLAAIGWLFARKPWSRAQEGIVAAAILVSIVSFNWLYQTNKHWLWTSQEERQQHLEHPIEFHAYAPKTSFDFLQAAREFEIRAGDRVAFTDIAMLGALFNFHFSNYAKYIPFTNASEYVSRIRAYNPKWVAVRPSSAAFKALDATGDWEKIGDLTTDKDQVALRKRVWSDSRKP
jgi:hypothetical protein